MNYFCSMFSEINIKEVFNSSLSIIDVRSPGEFEKGHIPNAVNIPLFTNDERAHVGIVYKQQSKEKAIELGYKYVTPKLQQYINEALKVAPHQKVIVHCWRGGMRSQSFAQHLSENGFNDVKVISGGYKAYRNYVLDTFDLPANLCILGGYTGSGKTYILKEFQQKGEQVIDLEGLAHHKGSAFGGIEQGEQPTVEQFENNLHEQWLKLDLQKRIWLEDESHCIGGVNIPMPLFTQIRNAPLLFIEIPKEERAKHLVVEYARCNKTKLAESIHRIAKRMGYQNEKMAVELLEQDKFFEVALLSLNYYDKGYIKGLQKRDENKVTTLQLDSVDHAKNANKILKYC